MENVMCIWEVAPEKRHCEFCTYLGGCEYLPERSVDYVSLMSQIVGEDILKRTREPKLAYSRYFVAYKMHQKGFSTVEIGRMFNLDYSTIIHGIKKVEEMLHYPCFYEEEMVIWKKFQESLNSQKNKIL